MLGRGRMGEGLQCGVSEAGSLHESSEGEVAVLIHLLCAADTVRNMCGPGALCTAAPSATKQCRDSYRFQLAPRPRLQGQLEVLGVQWVGGWGMCRYPAQEDMFSVEGP